MIPLSVIPGLTPDAADLLTAAGIRSVNQLARQDAASLHSRLEVLAWQRGRTAHIPPREHLDQWIALADMMTPPASAEVLSMDDIPEAVEVAPAASPAWMPPALRAVSDATNGGRPQPAYDAPAPQPAPPDNSRRKVDPARFTTLEDYNEGRTAVQPLSRGSIKDKPAPPEADTEEAPAPRRQQRIRSTGGEVSRWVRRGVVHPRPMHTWLGALVSVVWRIAMVSAIAAVLWFVGISWFGSKTQQMSEHTEVVVIAASILLVLGCMQLHFAGRSRCRICSCNLFYSKNCHKNRKAHMIPGFGYVASAALHLLIFGWFRCMYCGTAVRLHPTRRDDD